MPIELLKVLAGPFACAVILGIIHWRTAPRFARAQERLAATFAKALKEERDARTQEIGTLTKALERNTLEAQRQTWELRELRRGHISQDLPALPEPTITVDMLDGKEST